VPARAEPHHKAPGYSVRRPCGGSRRRQCGRCRAAADHDAVGALAPVQPGRFFVHPSGLGVTVRRCRLPDGNERRSCRPWPCARREIAYPARLRRNHSNSLHDHTLGLWRLSGVDDLPMLQRARVIFAGSGKIGCRRCLRVRYRSQCGDAKDRTHLAIAKIEKRLITRRGRFYKPKGMLWRTFHRLCDRYDHHDALLNAGLMRALGRLGCRRV
jgi:hypothetical protein